MSGQTRIVDEMLEGIRHLGPFRKSPTGTLFAYARTAEEEGDPVGIYVNAENLIDRQLTRLFPTEWTPARRHHVLEFLRAESFEVFEEVTSPWINTKTGLLDLSDPYNPAFLPHSPLFGLTSQLPVTYSTTAECPEFSSWAYQALPEPEETLPFLYELIGYSLLPLQFLRKAVLLTGPSGTGKSTLLYVLEKLAGQESVSYVPLQSFGSDRFAVSDLYGKLINIGGDLDATEVEHTGMFKSLTGDDYVRADVKYGKPIRFRSSATCWFAANEPPPSRDHTDAWRDRWVILPFLNKPATPDVMLRQKLTTESELAGIFRHSVDAVIRLLARGKLNTPQVLQDAHQLFAMQTDHVQAFLYHIKQQAQGQFLLQSSLYTRYTAYCEEEGIRSRARKQVLLSRVRETWGMPTMRNGTAGYNFENVQTS